MDNEKRFMKSQQLTLFLIIVSLLGSQWAHGDEQSDKLLNAYAQTQDRFSKYIIKYESKRDYDNNLSAPYDNKNGHLTRYHAGEVRCDGFRYYSRLSVWGNVFDAQTTQPKDKPQYLSRLYDGSMRLQYSYTETSQVRPKGFGFVKQKGDPNYHDATKEEMMCSSDDGLFLGRLNDDTVRVDEILRSAPALEVSRGKGELAGCYVISGKTAIGHYTIWLDPAHDYHIARAELHRRAGDLYSFSKTKPLPKDFKLDFVLKDVKFKKFDVGWLPISAYSEFNREAPNGVSTLKQEIKRVEVKTNPDFEALQSFISDDIVDGAPIKKSGFPIQYTWHDGKLTP